MIALLANGVLWALLHGCSVTGDEAPRPVPVEGGAALSLMALSPVSVSLPEGSTAREAHVPLRGPFVRRGVDPKGRARYEARLPFQPRGLFFHRVEPGLELTHSGERVRYGRGGLTSEVRWTHDATHLVVALPPGSPAPDASVYRMHYPKALERASRRDPHLFAGTPEDFIRTTVRDGDISRSGLLLPAPAAVTYEVNVPLSGELRLDAGIAMPEWSDQPRSDGAAVVVDIDAGQGAERLTRWLVSPGRFTPRTLDLSAWQGQTVRLTLSSDPSGHAHADHVFLGEPVVSTRKRDARRVVLVFLDTVRPDRLSLYGASRDTSAALDPMLQDAVVFDAARSIAPWTLPSARTVMTGRQPEEYAESETLSERLSGLGWATAMFAGNVYLSANFDMDRGWGLHKVTLWPQATQVVDDALAWLQDHEGQDALLQVQFMEAHLPYDEPLSYQQRYAGVRPPGLRDGFHLSDIRSLKPLTDAHKAYIVDRYDNNLRYLTDEVARLLSALGPQDVVVLFGDHGEEFWDHGGFEHGHTVYEELLRVPLVIGGPGVTGGRVAAPVSLLDVVPTIYDLLGLDAVEVDGRSLVPLMRGGEVPEDWADRALGFGRPLYGADRWGVLEDGHKWSTSAGASRLVDLEVDPAERDNLLGPPAEGSRPFADALARHLGCKVDWAIRLVNRDGRKPPKADLKVQLTLPGSVEAVVEGSDPLDLGSVEVQHADRQVDIVWPAGRRGSREVFVVPSGEAASATFDLQATLGKIRIEESLTTGGSGWSESYPLAARTLMVTHGWVPRCEGPAVSGTDAELRDALEAMGYVDPS